MSDLICLTLPHFSYAITASQTNSLCSLQIRLFSSSLASIERTPNQHSFARSYRSKFSCGITQEKALSTSKHVDSENPDSVIVFLENHGFSKPQISLLINKLPPNLLSDPQKSLFRLIDFLKSKGASSTDIAQLLSTTPSLLKKSLENQIIPSFNLLKDLLQSEEETIALIKRSDGLLLFDLQNDFVPNIEFLQEAGVPTANILFLLTRQPKAFRTSKDKFRQAVEEVEDRGFDPSQLKFMVAVHVVRSMRKSTWDKKVEVYKKWGWSEDEILVAFGKFPWCMSASVEKIMAVMDFFVNKMGWESSYFVDKPELLSSSLEKRIVPRCEVYQALVSKGLMKDGDVSFNSMLKYTEKEFLMKFVNRYEEEAHELLELYKEKLSLAK